VPLRRRTDQLFWISRMPQFELPDLSHQTWVGLESFKTLSCCCFVAVASLVEAFARFLAQSA